MSIMPAMTRLKTLLGHCVIEIKKRGKVSLPSLYFCLIVELERETQADFYSPVSERAGNIAESSVSFKCGIVRIAVVEIAARIRSNRIAASA